MDERSSLKNALELPRCASMNVPPDDGSRVHNWEVEMH